MQRICSSAREEVSSWGSKCFGEQDAMPSYNFNQLVDLEEMMCKQLLSLDLRDQGRDPREQSLSAAMRTPGYTGQPRKEALFSSSSTSSLFSSSSSQLSTEPSDAAYLSSCQWGQQSDNNNALPSSRLPPNSTRWSKPGFWAERSLSMVETGSSAAHTLGWPGVESKQPPEALACPPAAALSAGSLPSCSSTASLLSPTSSSSSSSSSSSRYKTEMCRTFAESGGCKYGSKCQFAHGFDELRDLSRHPKYKTEPCRTFHTVGFCPYGIRCHFVHNNEEEEQAAAAAAANASTRGGPCCAPPPPCPSRPRRPPLLRQSFSFAGFPSALPLPLQPSLPPLPPSFLCPPSSSFSSSSSSSSPPAAAATCADITDLLSHALMEMDSAFAALPPPSCPRPDPRGAAHFLPSPDSGCSLSGLSPVGLSPASSPPGLAATLGSALLGARSLSRASLSDPEQDGSSGSSTSSLSGSESSGVLNDGRRLAVFSQLSVPDDVTGFFL